jgi:hypothetical protein
VCGVARNALACVSGAIPHEQGAAESERLWTEIAEQQVTQQLAREEKGKRLKRRRAQGGRVVK